MPDRVLDIELAPPQARDSFVGCVASLFSALGTGADATEVAGMSGRAFLVALDKRLERSGRSLFDWNMLAAGTGALGREVELVVADYQPMRGGAKLPRELASALFDRVTSELDQGNCSIVRGATDAPEFGIVYGTRGRSYLVRSHRSGGAVAAGPAMRPFEVPEPVVPHDRVRAAGCLVALFTGAAVPRPARAARDAVARAVALLDGKHPGFEPGMAVGVSAFESWAAAVKSGDYDPAGHRANLELHAELQAAAAGFCRRLQAGAGQGAEGLGAAAGCFEDSSTRLAELLLPDRAAAPAGVPGPSERSRLASVLAGCAGLNRRASEALRSALTTL